MATPVTDALGLAEDAVLAALAAQGLTASWAPASPDLARRMGLPSGHAEHLARAAVCHHQDGGGRASPLLHSAGWSGLITIRVLSRDRAQARAGLALAVTALGALTSPSGYAIRAAWQRPVAIPRTDPLAHVAAGIWQLTIRRVA